MKKNYTKPSLLAETFVAKNSMSGDLQQETLSTGVNLYLNGQKFNTFVLGENNQLQTINISDYVGR